MNRLRLSYGFKGPEREELLKKTMSSNPDKVFFSFEKKNYNSINFCLGY